MNNLDVKKFSLGFDLSTTNVGCCLFDGLGKLVELKHLQLEVDKKINPDFRYLHKAELFKEYLIEFKKRVESEYACVIVNVFVEEPLANTNINTFTTNMLLRFNGICCYLINQIFEFPPQLISVYDSRKLFLPELVHKKMVKGKIKETLSFPKNVDKKEFIWKKVAKLEPNIEWIYGVKNKKIKKESFDMSDSYVVTVAGLKLKGVIK